MPNDDTKKSRPHFEPFQGPNYTLVPDEVFDRLLPELTGAELKVLLYIIRRTFGFKKDADSISLSQMLNGITKRDGTVQDRGVGLSKASLLAALRALQEMNLLLTERRQSVEKGNEPPTIYRLNVQTPLGLETRPPLVKKVDQGVGQEIRPSPWSKNQTTQETKEQDTEEQQHGDDVVGKLTEFGVSGGAARTLAQTYEPAYIETKLDLVCWLKKHQPKTVGKNPAGFLRRALEEDYQPPAGYQTAEQRAAENEAKARRQLEAEATIRAEEARQTQERQLEHERRATALAALRREHPPAQIPGSALTTETAWQTTLLRLQDAMSGPNYQTWLQDSIMASCDGSQALIVAPSGFVADWLRTKFSPLIRKELQQVLGFPVQLDYIALTEISAEHPDASTQKGTSAHAP